MTVLAPGVSFADLQFQHQSRVIATGILTGTGGVTIVDPGPSSCLPTLRGILASAGLALSDVTGLFLTHIHLDHAGATGTLLRENPAIRVFVHESGAPHLVDPARLVASATRLYGDAMDRLWGPIHPVPASALVPLRGGELATGGGRHWRVAYTPGHASHHVSYFDADSGVAFVGDTAGVQIVRGGFVLPPTPPPDIDLARWEASLRVIEQWHPRTLVLTHFGATDAVAPHLAELRDHLGLCERIARDVLATDGATEAGEARFVERVQTLMLQRMPAADVQAYAMAGRFDLNWRGLVRFLTKKAAG